MQLSAGIKLTFVCVYGAYLVSAGNLAIYMDCMNLFSSAICERIVTWREQWDDRERKLIGKQFAGVIDQIKSRLMSL